MNSAKSLYRSLGERYDSDRYVNRDKYSPVQLACGFSVSAGFRIGSVDLLIHWSCV